jgi:hypothetical protein
MYGREGRRNQKLHNSNQIALPEWFAVSCDQKEAASYGFRRLPGGVHLSKTLMLEELARVLDVHGPIEAHAIENAILDQNILSKPTGTARKLVLARLNTLYGITKPLPVQAAMLQLWTHHAAGHPMLALLCALAREPLLRDSASVVLSAPQGTALRWPALADSLAAQHPGRYSPKMLKSLAQNCASSWTQSGHLKGTVAKRRSLAEPTAQAAAYAALLGSLAGFAGPLLLSSPWMRVLDRSEADVIALLRRAEALGMLQMRVGGGVFQIEVRRPMAEVTGVMVLADG